MAVFIDGAVEREMQVYLRGQLNDCNWDEEKPPKHPVAVRMDERHLYEHPSGRVIATAADGWQFYYAHRHIHVAPADWNGVFDT